MAEAGFRAYWFGSERVILDKGDLKDYWMEISGQTPETVTNVDLFYLCSIDQGTANVSYLLARYLFRHAEGRKSGARLSRGYFIRHLATHFGLVNDQGLRGLSVVVTTVAGAPGADEDAPAADEGAQAVPAPTRVSTWMISCMTHLMDASGRTYQAFDSTLVGSSRLFYHRRVRPKTGNANTSIAPHTNDHPDP
uniref:Uncharacterized protein n=1 Tax=Tanacetum cinerariifolium TaxID=118510 RepID=A0A6L2P5D4_TANCI|nr:hypothetical protein [Tanacetum cinerariifolium]